MELAIFDSTADCLAQSPVDSQGRAVVVGTPENLRRFGWVSPTTVDRVFVRLFKGRDRKLTARIGAWSSALVVSYELYDALRQFSIDDAIHFLPADIVTWARREKVDQYLCAFAMGDHDILDYDRAEYKTVIGTAGTPVVIQVDRWVAARERVPAYDLFRCRAGQEWIVSERLRDAIIARGFTGCRFVPIEVSQ